MFPILALGKAMARRRILVVEDSDEDVRLIKAAFDEHSVDADVQFVRDADSALRELNRADNTEGPDLIVLDIDLPGESGLTVLRKLRHGRFDALPVIVFTGSESLIERDEAVALGVSAYMNKPLELREYLRLGATVKRLVSPEQSSDQPASRMSVHGKGLSEAS